MTRRLLVVCTANVCRSPSVERLFRRRFDGLTDLDGEVWEVSSAGTADVVVGVDRNTLAAGRSAGIDLTGHERRTLTADLVATDGADLIVCMEREHLRSVATLDPAAWPRTFTLKELARRATAAGPPTAAEGYEGWLRRVADGRTASSMMTPDDSDDVADPFGLPRRQHEAMMQEVDALVDAIVRVGPWGQTTR